MLCCVREATRRVLIGGQFIEASSTVDKVKARRRDLREGFAEELKTLAMQQRLFSLRQD